MGGCVYTRLGVGIGREKKGGNGDFAAFKSQTDLSLRGLFQKKRGSASHAFSYITECHFLKIAVRLKKPRNTERGGDKGEKKKKMIEK